ncbi:MAG: TonB-dependent receptor [Ignavibacteriae bacterium]|nr:TonB-dependent receptor [Ignavibacteriota bacterium]
MHKRMLIAILCFVFIPAALFAQTGKIAGKVMDRETGEPLIGANVKIDGTSRGATTNINGEYVILNVPIGKVTLVATYVGYQNITIRDVLVRSQETTQKDFQLPSEAYKVGEVEIIAERPLVDKNVTNSKSTVTQEDIENLPVRGVESIAALQAGVVSSGGTLFVRGSRGDATGYVVDGVVVNNPLAGGRALTVIQNSIAEVNFQAGGYSAEFGGANGGLISTTTRSGGRRLQVGFEAFTDGFYWTGWDYSKRPVTLSDVPGYYDAATGKYDLSKLNAAIPDRESALGTYSTGTSVYTMTVGGPLWGPVKFFVAGENSFARTGGINRRAINLTQMYDAALRSTAAHSLLPESERNKIGIFDPSNGQNAEKVNVSFPAAYIPNQAGQNWASNGNLTIDLSPINFRLGGSYSYSTSRGGVGIGALANERRASLNEGENYAGNLKMTHLLNNSTFYEIYLNYFGSFGITYDPDHKHNIFAYGDSIANAAFGYTYRAGDNLPLTTALFDGSFTPFGYPMTNYAKTRYNSIGGKINFVHQIGRTHEIKVGGEATKYTIRSYGIDAINLWRNIRVTPDISAEQLAVTARSNYYGYDMYGATDDTEFDGPKEPVFAAFYALDKIELEDLVINVGLRYDYINTASKQFKDPRKVLFDDNGNIDPAGMEDVPASETVSPRLGFSFPVTDQTVFYAQYGKFVQQSRLRDVYLGNSVSASNIRGGYAIQTPVGYGLKPERTTQYDFGFRQQIGEYMAFDIGAFYKDIRDQIQMQQITAAAGAQHSAYYSWVNGDFATTSGVSLKLDLRRVERMQASLDYTYSDARGTGSSPSESFYAIWQSPTETPYLPKYTMPLDFDQTHRGSVNIDYRFGKDDGPAIGGAKFLERTGLNVVFAFHSGSPYTRVDEFSFGNRRQPVESINSSHTPWVFSVDGRLDKSFSVAGLDFNVYLRVINLLNIRSATGVFSTSGAADDDGYLATEEGQSRLKGIQEAAERVARENGSANAAAEGQLFRQMYQDYYYQMNILNAGTYAGPRQIFLGLRVDF